MSRSSWEQASFKSGEWSPMAQGRANDPNYSTAMDICLNTIPLEQEAAERRSGLAFLVPTRYQQYAVLLPFDGSPTCSFAMEFTDDAVRFITQSSLVFDNSVYTINSEIGGAFTLSSAPGWSVGDEVVLSFPDRTSTLYPYSTSLMAGLQNRVMRIDSIASAVIGLADDAGTTFDTTNMPAGSLVGAQIMRVKKLTTTYAGQSVLDSLRAVQAENQAIVLCPTVAPQSCRITTDGTLSADPVFAFDVLNFIDGPYNDPSGDTCTVSAYTGTITVTASTTTPFASTDVGRHIRLFSQPADWAVGTAYVTGNRVTDADGAWWEAIADNTGVQPGTLTIVGGVNTVVWVPAPTAGSWAWGKISAFTDSSHVSVTLDTSIDGMTLQSANGSTMTSFQLGVYSGSTAYPTCGAYHQGRLWLAGATANRFDASVSNGLQIVNGSGQVTFSPTDPYGNVLDSNGISEILNSKKLVQIQWLIPHDEVLVAGTLGGEFVIRASTLNDPITPTSIDAKRVTSFGSTNIEPVEGGMAILFVQKYGKLVIEYLADAFSGKFSGRHLNRDAKHLAASGIKRIVHQEESTPTLWALMNNGTLVGASYLRQRRFVSEPPDLNAWHWHLHGGLKVFTSMAVVPGKNGLRDRLFLVTNNAPLQVVGGSSLPNQGMTNGYYVTVMQPLAAEADTIRQGWFVDEASGFQAGTSGTDCGGGNAFTFAPGPPLIGADSVTPDMSTVPPYPGLPAAGTTTVPTTAAYTGMGPATYFDGNTALYGMDNPGSNTTEMSMSVWLIGYEAANYQAGALVSSPALDESEANAKNKIVSCLVAGAQEQNNFWIAAAGDGLQSDGSGNGIPAYLNCDLSAESGVVWIHLMVSAKTDGTGNIVVTAAVNDTVLFTNANQTAGVVGNNNAMWPFAAEADSLKDLGPSVWTIGGVNVEKQEFGDVEKILPGPTIVEKIVSQNLNQILAMIKQYGRSALVSAVPGTAAGALTSFTSVADAVKALTYTESYQTSILEVQAGNGGNSNLPVGDVTGGYQGWQGSINELWIAQGTFIDWTSSTERNKFHGFDTVANVYFPVSLGAHGETPTGSAPWVYCAGDHKTFPVNRATGKTLTVSGALQDAATNWPPQAAT